MTKLIDKDAVVAEIERLFLPVKNEPLGSGNPEVFYYYGLINFLNSLEVKEVDTNKVIKPTEWSEEEIIKKHITYDSISEVVNDRLNKCGWYVTENHSNLESNREIWSEEDDRTLGYLLAVLEDGIPTDSGKMKKIVDWLKSLKYRVQPKHESNEEDEHNVCTIQNIICASSLIETTEEKCKLLNWLKSLKQRIGG